MGIRAATVHVRDDIDNFIKDIHRQSWSTTSTSTRPPATRGLSA
jgi:hypothetical protein